MELRKGRDRGSKDGVSWWGMVRLEGGAGSSDDKWLKVRRLQWRAENGVFGRRAGRNGKKRVDLGEEC